MYRILPADKDAYITNKIIYSSRPSLSRSTDANVGQAGTLDLFKLYNETPVPVGTSGIEISRALMHFDLDRIRSLTGSLINISDPSFKCYVSLKDVYGGQTVPSNFSLTLYPLAKNFVEGRGNDVIGYRDLDVVNWFTASLDNVYTPIVNPEMVEYQEDVVNVLTASNIVTVPFVTPFTSVPPVVITDISSALGTVNSYVGNGTTASTLVVKFSAPFSGSFVYRAVADITPGSIKTVVRVPRYPGVYANVVVGTLPIVNNNFFSVGYNDFGGTPSDTYASLYETTTDDLTNVYTTITSSTTLLIAGTFSAVMSAQVNVLGYRSLDQIYGINSWLTGGVEASGAAGDVSGLNTDYYSSFLSSTGYVPLGFSQTFSRGDENLYIDVTTAVSATLAGILPDYGFRLSYSGSQETDTVTRFVKRFSTRQSRNTDKHPSLVVKYNDTFIDNQAAAYFDYSNKLGVYYSPFGMPTNFFSGSSVVAGSGSIMLELVASQSAYVTATTYSFSHRANINYLSSSWNYFSQSFTGSQVMFGGKNQSGIYYADVYLPSTLAGLSGVLKDGTTAVFTPVWKSLDNTVIFTTGPSVTFRKLSGASSVVPQNNYTINVTNLKDNYTNIEAAKLRVFVASFDPTLTSFYLPYKATPKICPEMYWRLIDPYSKDIIIPFDTSDSGTKLSADGEGMYFNLYMQDLTLNKPLELQFLIREYGSDHLIENEGFIFKVVTA